MHIKPIISLPVSRRTASGGRESALLTVKHPPRREIAQLTALYNSVVDLVYEEGLLVMRGQIASRLERDPGSIFAAYLDGRLVGMINVVKLHLSTLAMMPTDHQSLTGDDSWETTDPRNANVWICPWVATHPEQGRGWKGEFADQPRSLGQLLVQSVAVKASLNRLPIEHVIAYSRPAGLRAYFGESIQPLSVINYIGTRTNEGRILDPVIRFHVENGARLIRDLIFPYGHTGDQNSLFYRTCLGYRL
ncbi:MAG: hypothetical protein KKC80_07450 [Candidatus Margulisbacteria bacterium]|nr:hypothetical protein [Candidatus Margulisiibacteriota bacterium]MBU1617509.1 hypothetical protein [Candidatus Margulisiibacteriota bacterium]